MARDPLDDAIDRLYQLPLEQFTAARNALAREAGAKAPAIKSLEKPSAAAWAVNQLYWHERPIYDELVEAAQQLRAAYRDQLAGKSPDVRGAEANHRAAVKRATQSARELGEADGGKASDAVIERRANQAAERERDMTRERLRFAEAAEREAEAALDRARRARERAQRTRERIERELEEASRTEKALRKEESAAEAMHTKAAAERRRLTARIH